MSESASPSILGLYCLVVVLGTIVWCAIAEITTTIQVKRYTKQLLRRREKWLRTH
jgi:hypothetical protein